MKEYKYTVIVGSVALLSWITTLCLIIGGIWGGGWQFVATGGVTFVVSALLTVAAGMICVVEGDL